jgi:NAD-dependent dihydropyrimidine dehydrogenase PreA subunit
MLPRRAPLARVLFFQPALRRSASNAMPDVPTSACKQPAGTFAPVIDPRRCEGKAACVAECPYDVFVVRRFERQERPGLGLAGTMKWWLHGGLQADVVRPDQCHACGLCVMACPEQAITLKRRA